MEEYNKELCDERHKKIDEKLDYLCENHGTVINYILGIYVLIITALLSFIGFMVYAN